MDVNTSTNASSQPAHALRRGTLCTSDAIAQSIALLALVMGIALSSSFAANSAGAAAPLAYLVVGLASLCLAYIIIRFTRRIASAGSVYTYIAQGLGPQAGFIGGWMYAGAFAIGISFVLAIASSFLASLFANVHLAVDWFVIYSVLLVALFLFAFFDIRISTRTQLALATVGVLSVLLMAVIILAKGGDSGLSLTPFSPAALPQGFSGLFFASVFSFTSFIGFEAAAVLGEEAVNPRFTIPRAILAAVIVAAIFYIFVSYAMSIGYGVTHASAWAQDQAPLDTLANRYSGAALATFIYLMVALNAFIAALAGVNLTARMLYAMGRDKGIPSMFGWTHPRFKSPWVGILAALLLTFILGVTLGRSLGVFTFFGFLATAGSLGILLAYILVALSGMIFFLRLYRAEKSGRTIVFDLLFPTIATLLCGATIYSSVIPVPPAPLNYAPYVMAGWLLLGLIVLVVLWSTAPARVSQFGKHFTDE
jgi:amino acid transporter